MIEVDREKGIIYRRLPMEERSRVKTIFDRNDWFFPPEQLSNISVAENEVGDIVGMQTLQLLLHAEPTWIDPNYTGKVNYLTLWKILEQIPKSKSEHLILPGYLLVAPTEQIQRMAELGGFKEIPGKIYKKEWGG